MSKKPKTTPQQPELDPGKSAPIYAALKRLGIVRIEVTYDGSCDAGCIDGITAYDAKGKPIDKLPDEHVTIVRRHSAWDEVKQDYVGRFGPDDVTLADAITDWCYDVLEEQFPSWGNDDGASGTITIDVAKRKGTLDHNERVIETISHERSF